MSHLTTLIKRVEKAEKFGEVHWSRLLNLAEYLVYYDDWSKEEFERAKELLEKHNFKVELTPQGIERKLIELKGLPDFYSRTCLRCGRRLSNPYSIRKGLGSYCRQKVKRGDWGKDSKVVFKGQKKLFEMG